MSDLKAITIKVPATTLAALREEARATGRSVADLVRERLEASALESSGSVHSLTADLAGSLSGSREAVTNERRRFRNA